MKLFNIQKFNISGEDSPVVLAVRYKDPLCQLKEIADELQGLVLDGKLPSGEIKVYFDFLLCGNDSSERFMKALFDGNNFLPDSFSYITVPKRDEFRLQSAKYFKDSNLDLNQTVLTSLQVKFIERGIAI